MKKSLTIFIVITAIVLVILFLILNWQSKNLVSSNENPPSFIYTDFGIFVPNGYDYYGIDVSRYQSVINWSELAQMEVQNISISFVFIKATEGRHHRDKRFKYNWYNAKKQNILRGAYHYYIPGASPEKQAKNFTSTVQLQEGDFPPVIDIEDRGALPSKQFLKDLKRFYEILADDCDCKPILYTYYSFYSRYLAKDEQIKKYPLWIARYSPDKPDNYPWLFWQFSDRATVDGIGHKVDMNVFSGDSTQLYQLLIK